jgi:4-amino-4-deoxy-L-arabinose transferase-like glycosyltransferase
MQLPYANNPPRAMPRVLTSDLAVLLLLAAARLVVHLALNDRYGWHRDELATLDDARYLAWGYVAYPPLTPAVARLGLELFGASLAGVRMFAALAQSVAMVLAGLMARELGGRRTAQVVAALAVATTPVSLYLGSTLMYVAFDYLWWVLVAYFVVRLLKTDDPRWWVAIGAAIGLGMQTKYTMGILVAGVVVGVVLTPTRRHLRSPWLWAGVAVALLLFLPNLVWQIRHDFISLEFLGHIHARDVRIGRTEGYWLEQLYGCTNPLLLPLWVAGLVYAFFAAEGRPYRMIGWMYMTALLLYAALEGRGYYLAPAYPMLYALGAVTWQQWLAPRSVRLRRGAVGYAWCAIVAGGALGAALMLPLAPINSPLWDVTADVHDLFREQIGWPELTATVAAIYADLPAAERSRAGILAGNYGEAGALNLYGPEYGLPEAISGTNSYWLRGYGDPPPETLIVLGMGYDWLVGSYFTHCELAGQSANLYNVVNEESRDHPHIYVCRGLRAPWPELWPKLRNFG